MPISTKRKTQTNYPSSTAYQLCFSHPSAGKVSPPAPTRLPQGTSSPSSVQPSSPGDHRRTTHNPPTAQRHAASNATSHSSRRVPGTGQHHPAAHESREAAKARAAAAAASATPPERQTAVLTLTRGAASAVAAADTVSSFVPASDVSREEDVVSASLSFRKASEAAHLLDHSHLMVRDEGWFRCDPKNKECQMTRGSSFIDPVAGQSSLSLPLSVCLSDSVRKQNQTHLHTAFPFTSFPVFPCSPATAAAETPPRAPDSRSAYVCA